MKLYLRDSIGIRFLRIVFGCYLAVTLVVTSGQLYLEYYDFEKEALTELSNIGESFENGLSKALWNIDSESIGVILTGIKKIDLISGVKVVDLHEKIYGAIGVYVDSNTQYQKKEISLAGRLKANDLTIDGEHTGNYYEYKLKIAYKGSIDDTPRSVGYVYLYADQNTVVKRFQYQSMLIITIALIKTIALWLIFLYFARSVVAKPLIELTSASELLSKGEKTPQVSENLQRLQSIAASKNRDEIQTLASGFLAMRKSINEKLDNLHTLNSFAVNLSQAWQLSQALMLTNDLLRSFFGCQFTVMFHKDSRIYWSSLNEIDMATIELPKIEDLAEEQHIKITYPKSPSKQANLDQKTSYPMLSLPIEAKGYDDKQLRIFGYINPERLDQRLNLTQESTSFLQVVSAMVSSCLTRINDRNVIEEHNTRLEKRVNERTQALAEANEELKHQALHDPLTSLPNRTLFNDRIEQLIKVADRTKDAFAVASIDLSKFKLINDNYGHDVGDTVLVEVSRRFSAVMRQTDTLSRMGGDEFAAIFPGAKDQIAIKKIVKLLLDSLVTPILIGDNTEVIANANIGVALYPDHATKSEQLFKMADMAMYQAKRSSLGYCIFDERKSAEENQVTSLINQLELAIVREELVLHYQPIIDLQHNKIVGFEALVRWIHPDKGLIPPGLFIQHAEKSPHITPLTHWVLKTACKDCAYLKKMGHDLCISVNLSARVFTSPSLPKDIENLLNTFELTSKNIKLEITESAAMTNPAQALEILERFKRMGLPISIDDFGTGHSSLAYLTKLPLNELKIDKEFLAADSTHDLLIIETIINLAHSLGLQVVAEGIESEQTRHMLVTKGCDYAQGYLFGKPTNFENLIPILQNPTLTQEQFSVAGQTTKHVK